MYFRKSLKRWKWMFPFEVKRPIWSALEIKFFKLYFLQPVLGSHPVLSGHLAIPRGWVHNTGSTVDLYMSIKSCVIDCILHFFPCNLAHSGIQFNAVYTGALKSSRWLLSFGIRVILGLAERCYFSVYTNLFSFFYQLTELHNVMTEWLNNTV